MKSTLSLANGPAKYLSSALLFMLLSVSASASSLGNYLGTFSGNDSVSALFSQLGLDATYLDKINLPATNTSNFSIVNTVLKSGDDDDIIAGDWVYNGTGIVTHIVIKAGPRFAVYEFTDGLNMGGFTTSDVNGKGLSHITAYSVPDTLASPVPVPAALWLMAGGMVSLLRLRKKR